MSSTHLSLSKVRCFSLYRVLEDLQRNQTEQDIVCKEVSDDVADLDGQLRQSMEEIRNINTMIKNNYKLILDAVCIILLINTLTQIPLVMKLIVVLYANQKQKHAEDEGYKGQSQLCSGLHWERQDPHCWMNE